MTVDEVYVLVSYCFAKSNGQGYISPDDFQAAINMAQKSYLDYLLGEYQQYQAGRPIPVIQFGQNETIKTSLIPLIYGKVLNIDSTGLSQYPSDFEQVDAMWSLYGFKNIRFTQQDRLDSYYNSVIDPIATNPVYLIKHEGFQFYPESLVNARLSYIRTPPNMLWGYNLDSNGLPVYDSTKSTQPIWSDLDLYNIIVRALGIIGINLQMPLVVQYANDIKAKGQ